MSAYYTYLLSSLPVLHFNGNVPFSYDELCAACEGKVPDADLMVIRELPTLLQHPRMHPDPALRPWCVFEHDLRNELARERARRLHLDPARYLREDRYVGLDVSHAASHAYKIPGILDAERYLDQVRWAKLDELSRGHFFDRAAMFYYALKLLLLLRWQGISAADAGEQLDTALAGIHGE